MRDRNFLIENNAKPIWHPMAHPAEMRAQPPRIIMKGEGIFVTDIEGRTVLDSVGGLWNVNLGFSCDPIKKAIADQLGELPYYSGFRGTSTGPSIELAFELTAGEPPTISFTIDGQRREMTPRLIVGADGRGSDVARQIGMKVETAPLHHLLAGLLVEGVDAWPDAEFSIGNDDDVMFFVFPQGNGRVRLYLCYGLDQRGRFSGADSARRFLDAFRLSSLPDKEMFCSAVPAGPCHGYPNADTWIDMPVAPGVVLIGDAAGHNDPTIGQGLSIAFRDARLVHEALLGSKRWTGDIFLSYATERRTRMRRLRFTAEQISILRAEFTETARKRRRRVSERIAADRDAALPLLIPVKGPFGVPDHLFEQAAWDALMN
jgi:2-polyprenyl-6-methoxyphenol hydroxylase-like FAD-dependent oxidoreductase